MSQTFRHSCFISYRNGNRDDQMDLLNKFAEQIYEALDSELRTQLEGDVSIFWDVKSLQGGYILNPHISGSVCTSICMVAIFTRSYLSEKKLFCASELYGMLECEVRRFAQMNINKPDKGHIITIALRNPDLVPDILKNRLFYDFSKFYLSEASIRVNPNYNDKISAIAEYIANRYEEMKAIEDTICTPCTQFALPDIDTEEGKAIIIEFIQKHRKPYHSTLQQS